MIIKTIQRRSQYIALSILASFILVSFQNCSQPGAISLAGKDSGNSTTGAVPPTSENPPTTPVTYKDLSKAFTVKQSSGKVDVLVVIDNSGSMEYEQQNMAKRFDTFIDKLSGLDWQVAIVTTDVDEDKPLKDGHLIYFSSLGKYILSSTDNITAAKAAFASAIQRPANEGSGLEQGIRATYRAIERFMAVGAANNTNAGLLRDGASLSVIVVTDSDETVGTKAGDESVFTTRNYPANLMNFVTSQLPNKNFRFSAIIVKPDDVACVNNKAMYTGASGKASQNTNEAYGKHYKQMIDLSGGVIGDVCAADYDEQLKIIGESATDQVRQVLLDCAPVDSDKDGRIDLTVRDDSRNIILTNYTVAGNKITFDQLLPISAYRIDYRCIK